jgi:hydroxypyruvate isomerase
LAAQWTLDHTCAAARELGCLGVDLLLPHDWPLLKRYGLICTIANCGMPDPVFSKGINNSRYHDEILARGRAIIDQCPDFGVPNFTMLTGYKWRDADDPSSEEISLEEGADNCVKAIRALLPDAERAGVNLCLEHLNTRDNTHDMKGHPGYQGDDIDYVATIVRRVNSPRVKILFDVYHVSVMNGDLIRRIREYGDLIGHIHTAGNPGRGELDATQEINYPAIMRALLAIGYTGYVSHEFIPTRNPMDGLREAVASCDV